MQQCDLLAKIRLAHSLQQQSGQKMGLEGYDFYIHILADTCISQYLGLCLLGFFKYNLQSAPLQLFLKSLPNSLNAKGYILCINLH